MAVHGFSRLGKVAVWAGAQDPRFAMVVSFQSGAGGVALSKRQFGERIDHLAGSLGHWFCANFARYVDNEAGLPMDQHELVALLAPRPVLITSATEDLWSDPRGEFLGGLGGDPVYRLLGSDGVAQPQWPAVGVLLTSRSGYFLRPGKHNVTRDDWVAAVSFAQRHLRP